MGWDGDVLGVRKEIIQPVQLAGREVMISQMVCHSVKFSFSILTRLSFSPRVLHPYFDPDLAARKQPGSSDSFTQGPTTTQDSNCLVFISSSFAPCTFHTGSRIS